MQSYFELIVTIDIFFPSNNHFIDHYLKQNPEFVKKPSSTLFTFTSLQLYMTHFLLKSFTKQRAYWVTTITLLHLNIFWTYLTLPNTESSHPKHKIVTTEEITNHLNKQTRADTWYFRIEVNQTNQLMFNDIPNSLPMYHWTPSFICRSSRWREENLSSTAIISWKYCYIICNVIDLKTVYRLFAISSYKISTIYTAYINILK